VLEDEDVELGSLEDVELGELDEDVELGSLEDVELGALDEDVELGALEEELDVAEVQAPGAEAAGPK
jgi:hypothetical protein